MSVHSVSCFAEARRLLSDEQGDTDTRIERSISEHYSTSSIFFSARQTLEAGLSRLAWLEHIYSYSVGDLHSNS